MVGKTDVSYDDKQQQAAAPKVTETWDTVTGSRKHTLALGSASMVILSSNAAPRSPLRFRGEGGARPDLRILRSGSGGWCPDGGTYPGSC